MKPIGLFAFLFGISGTVLFADSPARPEAYVTSSGVVYFKMIPREGGSWDHPNGLGIAYEIQDDGSDRELWRTEGWYSFEVFLSGDGKYLVAMGPWNFGDRPKKEDLAISFYREGRLLKQYSTADLVKDPSKVRRSTSHYRWLARDTEWDPNKEDDPKNKLRLLWNNTFRLRTCDGIVYTFDITTGEIKDTSP